MLLPKGPQFHPTVVTVMGQVNQALTGYGAVSAYGPQIFEFLGFGTDSTEFLTLGNYISYFCLMTFAWLSIDVFGRFGFLFCILTIFGDLAKEVPQIPDLAIKIPRSITMFVATRTFGIGWLATAWRILTEIYPSTARAKGSAVSVIVWGLANFAVTLLTPIGFNNLKYWLFLVFAGTNAYAGWWTWVYSPETGGRSFEENQEFFRAAKEEDSWAVREVDGGKFKTMPSKEDEERSEERSLLLGRR